MVLGKNERGEGGIKMASFRGELETERHNYVNVPRCYKNAEPCDRGCGTVCIGPVPPFAVVLGGWGLIFVRFIFLSFKLEFVPRFAV